MICPRSSGFSCRRRGGGAIESVANHERELTRVVWWKKIKNRTDFFGPSDRLHFSFSPWLAAHHSFTARFLIHSPIETAAKVRNRLPLVERQSGQVAWFASDSVGRRLRILASVSIGSPPASIRLFLNSVFPFSAAHRHYLVINRKRMVRPSILFVAVGDNKSFLQQCFGSKYATSPSTRSVFEHGTIETDVASYS
jgi:hypothetical protein